MEMTKKLNKLINHWRKTKFLFILIMICIIFSFCSLIMIFILKNYGFIILSLTLWLVAFLLTCYSAYLENRIINLFKFIIQDKIESNFSDKQCLQINIVPVNVIRYNIKIVYNSNIPYDEFKAYVSSLNYNLRKQFNINIKLYITITDNI